MGELVMTPLPSPFGTMLRITQGSPYDITTPITQDSPYDIMMHINQGSERGRYGLWVMRLCKRTFDDLDKPIEYETQQRICHRDTDSTEAGL
jgi:hypothetical protein